MGRRGVVILVAAILILAAAVRVYRLGIPDTLVFDEVYYAQDACLYLGSESCGIPTEASRVHPPLGKWIISVGIGVAGYNPLGWRIAAAMAGTLTVGLSFVLARRLMGGVLGPTVAAVVLALDPLSVVSSRVAMLDVFVACACTAMVLFAVIDRDSSPISGRRARLFRPWRAAAGMAAGCAIAVKWSGALVLAAVIGLVLLWDVVSALKAGRGRLRGLVAASPSVLLWLVVTPAVIYGLSYAGRLEGTPWALPWEPGSWWREFAGRQWFMANFHFGLEDTHPYASPAWSWLLGKRAVVYYFEVDQAGRYREILAFANPLLWLPAAGAWLAACVVALRTRRPSSAEVVIAASVAAAYLPWLGLTSGRSFVFLHYLLPVLPFLALSLGWIASRARPLTGRLLGGLLAVIALVAFAFWHPLIYARPLEYDEWRMRIPFTDCTAAERSTGRLMPREGGGPSPPGWCWV